MRVWVIGATGLLGSHIVDLCVKNKDTVRVLVRESSNLDYLKKYPDIEYSYGSLSDLESLMKAAEGVDVVYHSAGRVSEWGTRKQFMETNFEGTVNVIEACKAKGVKRLVYVSSPSVVFNYEDELNIDESRPYPKKFANYYSESKALAEQYVIANHDPAYLQTVVVRPHAIWGPRDKAGFLARIIARLKEGKMVNLSGGKTVMTDLCYVLNAAHACVLAAASKEAGGKIYFIADDAPTDAWKFFNEVAGKLGLGEIKKSLNPHMLKPVAAFLELLWKIPYFMENVRLPLNRYSLGVMTTSSTYDLSAARKDLNYKPLVDMKTGLDNLAAWIDEKGGIASYVRDVEVSNKINPEVYKIIPLAGWVLTIGGLFIKIDNIFLYAIWLLIVFATVVVHIFQIPVAIPIGRRAGYGYPEIIFKTMLYGAAWWVPLKQERAKQVNN